MDIVMGLPAWKSSRRSAVRLFVMEDMAQPVNLWGSAKANTGVFAKDSEDDKPMPAASGANSTHMPSASGATSSRGPPVPLPLPPPARLAAGGPPDPPHPPPRAQPKATKSEYKWQVKTGKGKRQKWTDACPELDDVLERAYTQDFDSTTWNWDGWTYYYEFGSEMTQTSPGEESTERPIRRVERDDEA